MLKKLAIVFLVFLFVAAVIAVVAFALVKYDFEHEKRKCGNCATRDDALGFCWVRDIRVGTEDKACNVFRKRVELSKEEEKK